MPSARRDPYLNFNFLVEIDGIAAAGFSEAELPEARIEAVAYREGADRTNASRLLPGRVEYGRLVLRRGFTGDPALFQWFRSVAEGNLDRRNVVVILRDQSGQEVSRWMFRQAWVTKYIGPSLRALGNEVAIETLELAHEGMELEEA
jgi:phage tail-like protein